MQIHWNVKKFDELTPQELYEILALRQNVFIIEQNCIYEDLDHYDQKATHIFAQNQDQKVIAYLRILPPKTKIKNDYSISRVATCQSIRKLGLGKQLMTKALSTLNKSFSNPPIRISAQKYLENFYQEFGFKTISEPYLEDGISHIEMLKAT